METEVSGDGARRGKAGPRGKGVQGKGPGAGPEEGEIPLSARYEAVEADPEAPDIIR